MTMQNNWTTYWASRPIPILEASKTALQQMLHRAERVRPADIAELALNDPLLVLQALRLMGKRPRSSLSADVVSIENIVMLMGTSPFLERFSHLPSVESILLPHAPDEYAAFLRVIFQSRFIKKMALQYADWRYDARQEEIAAASILSLCNSLLAMVGSRMDSHLPPVQGAEEQLLASLNIPENVVQLLAGIENAPQRVVLQQAVMRLVKSFELGWWQTEVQQEIELIAGILDAEADLVWQALCKTALDFARDPLRWPQVQQPARWLPMLPGEWPKPQIKVAESAASEPARSEPIRVKTDPLADRMQALHLAGKQGVQAKDIMALAVRALAEGLGLQRIVFSLLTPGQAELRTRFALGVPQTDPMRQLAIRCESAGLLNKMLEKPQSLWFRPDNAAQFAPHLPTSFKQHFASEQFLMMSIFIGEKPLGLIIADQHGAGALTEFHFQHFKQICLLTTRALTHGAAR